MSNEEQKYENRIMSNYNNEIDNALAEEAARDMFFSQTITIDEHLRKTIKLLLSYEFDKQDIWNAIKVMHFDLGDHEFEFIEELIDEVLK